MRGHIRYVVAGRRPGWPDGTPVSVVSYSDTYATVRRDTGEEVSFPHWEVDVGNEYEIDCEWMHESHPKALDFIESRLRASLAATCGTALEKERQENIRRDRELLARYGRCPA